MQANWRSEVAKNVKLLRRTEPFQLALLSHLRQDEKILPVFKAVWNQSLHSSCPFFADATDLQKAHWRPVAESLLGSRLDQMAMLCQLHDVPALTMPGSPAVMQIIFPQLQGFQGFQQSDHDFSQVLLNHSTQLAAVLRRCLPDALWQVLKAAGEAMSHGEVGSFGEDVITEVATRACRIVQEWPGSAIFTSVRSHLQSLIGALLRSMPGMPSTQ